MSYFAERHPRYTVIGAIRAILRLSFAVVVLAVQLGVIVVSGAVPPGSYRERLFTALTGAAGRTFLWFLNVRLRVRGPRPPAGSVIVANHIGWIDGFVYAAALGCRFVAISWIHDIPLARNALRTLSVESIRRSALRDLPRLNATLDAVASAGRSMMFFPEATTHRGDRVYDFRSALLDNSARRSQPVYWSALSYRIPVPWVPVGLIIPWPDWTPLILQAYRVAHIPRTIASVTFGAHPERCGDRRELARRLQDRVSGAFEPLEQAPPELTARYFRKANHEVEVF